ncbi:M3 family oligoendopeptidase [Cohnella nanjingensis]|uniref:M3 family oligoendopeptidase n=1 Tax=Cohnella nanjingensis TaxID=1387779 RepID=A0A7X0RNW3_9BACL|nr:M3 family oligoendopeptidase [Cohnella nanjingensis]MBB6670895.1 M3 family oligoendopeptidase [Cohnella nanjingensis]
MSQGYSLVWDLDTFFAGGSASPAFASYSEETEALVNELLASLKTLGEEAPGEEALNGWTAKLQDALSRLVEGNSFIGCLSAQKMDDRRAVAWTEKLQTLSARYRQVLDLYDAALARLSDEAWTAWSATPAIAPIAFVLQERRDAVKDKLPPALEALAGELAVDGYHGWSEHYQTIVGRIAIPWEEEGGSETLSAGQAFNKLEHPDQAVRDAMAQKWESAWADQADLAADTLNRLGGFRLKLYGARGWNDVLKEPLQINRMSRDTLDAMWEAVAGGIEPLKRYLRLKAKLLGKDSPAWHDVDAPVGAQGKKIPFDEAAALITDAFAQFSPAMAELSKKAFEGRWIEAEDRSGKRPGGFCTSFPRSHQTRIFMTYSGTPGNVSTLAHELGHAYHDSLVTDLPMFGQEYAMNVAETASTFAEALVSDALLSRADNDEVRLALLDERLQKAVAFFMNIRARFLFETRFYAARQQGMVDASQLSELMVAAQQEAFGGALSTWHPHFWASKLHFYITDVPFYNFPYTFGYLFSTGLVSVAEKEGKGFDAKYDRLLRDTGLMTVEELGSRHLGIALDKPDFWRAAVARATADVDAMAALIR